MRDSLLSDDEIKKTEDWLNEHGQPDYEYLQSLATDGSPSAMEKLKSIANDVDAEHTANASAEELIENIRLAVRKNAN